MHLTSTYIARYVSFFITLLLWICLFINDKDELTPCTVIDNEMLTLWQLELTSELKGGVTVACGSKVDKFSTKKLTSTGPQNGGLFWKIKIHGRFGAANVFTPTPALILFHYQL